MKKKLLGLVLALCLAMTAFVGCGSDGGDQEKQEDTGKTETKDPAEAIAGSYFVFSFNAEGYGQQTYFFHFYEKDPVMGSVFYFGNEGLNFAGTYEVVKEETSYACYPNREEASKEGGKKEEGKADYAVVFYDWNGNELGRCAYDGEILYNDQTAMSIIGGDNVMYHVDKDGEKSQYTSAYEAEKGVAYISFVDPANEESTLDLCHNMQFKDLMDTIIEGTWTREEQEDGSVKYTLTPEDGEAYEVVAAADGQTAVYKKDGAEKTLNVVQEAKITEAYQSEVFNYTSMSTDGQITIKLYDDGTAELDVYFPAWSLHSPVAGTYEGTQVTFDGIPGALEIANDQIVLPASLGMSSEDVICAKVDPATLEQ